MQIHRRDTIVTQGTHGARHGLCGPLSRLQVALPSPPPQQQVIEKDKEKEKGSPLNKHTLVDCALIFRGIV